MATVSPHLSGLVDGEATVAMVCFSLVALEKDVERQQVLGVYVVE